MQELKLTTEYFEGKPLRYLDDGTDLWFNLHDFNSLRDKASIN